MKRFSVLFENDSLLAVYKPFGVAVHGGAGVGVSLIDEVNKYLGGGHYLLHRLDRDTSGIVMLAKTREAASRFARVLSNAGARKEYRALCVGAITPKKGIIDCGVGVRGAVKPARTKYRVISANERFSYTSLELITGRTHQIRVHLARRGVPIIADDKYGDFAQNRALKAEYGAKRLMLCACRVYIPGGRGVKAIDIKAPLPGHMLDFIKQSGLAADGLKP